MRRCSMASASSASRRRDAALRPSRPLVHALFPCPLLSMTSPHRFGDQ
ncbi:hypothetical protein STXM2123_4019 [Streptomyces sp. F-3]|nr:hypothetical protein STXM2123_4019 [Streptomyces sp. F-3]